jgi:hypothetical protein
MKSSLFFPFPFVFLAPKHDSDNTNTHTSVYIYRERERERERERVLGGDIESARGLGSAIPKNDGDTGQLVHELLAIVGV